MGKIVLTRVDSRLIHGQVMTKWVNQVQANKIVIVSDELANDEFMKSIYLLSAPAGITVDCLTAADAVKSYKDDVFGEGRILLLLPSLQVLESIFNAGIGEIFTIRVAGNVITETQLGSIEYAAGHLGSKVILVLGHTNCGAVGAATAGGGHGYVKYLTDEIKAAIGDEKDDYKACGLNVKNGVDKIVKALTGNEEINMDETDIIGAIYDIEDGHVDWL